MAIAVERGWVAERHDLLLYQAAPVFREYVETLYAKRMEYKATGDRAAELVVKLLLNSLYGKFAQRQIDKWRKPDADERLVHYRPGTEWDIWEEEYEWDANIYLQIDDDLYATPDRQHRAVPVASESVLSIAGYITAAGRAQLWRGMAGVIDMGGTLFMGDTDSLATDVELPASMVDPKELGKWKLEKSVPGSECNFVAPKHYQFGDEIRIKGVTRPASVFGPFTQPVFPRLTTDMVSKSATRRERLETGAVMSQIVKNPTGVNTKRLSQGDGMPTLPIVVGNDPLC